MIPLMTQNQVQLKTRKKKVQEGVLCDQEIPKCTHMLQHMEHKAHHFMQCDWLRVSELDPVGYVTLGWVLDNRQALQ